MTGDFAGAPDAGGGFTLGIAVSAVPIDAAGCHAGWLSVDMNGLRPGPSGSFTSRQDNAIAHRLAIYKLLQDAKSSNTHVKLYLHTDAKYLFLKDGRLTAPFCAVTIDDAEAPHD